jgi:hypothetical protein
MSQVTRHVSYAEITQTSTGLPNEPKPQHMNNIIALCENVFEPLRKHVGKPIKINSVYRSEAVNKKIGGSATSQHCKGEAMDIDDTFGAMSNNEMAFWIMENLNFDQLIFEKPVKGKASWIHVSYSVFKNRKQVLIFDGKKYLPFQTNKHLIY